MTAARLRTPAIGASGAAVFYYLDMPLPLLIGPMLACLVAALAGVPLQGVGVVSVGMRTIVGVAVGASIMNILNFGNIWVYLLANFGAAIVAALAFRFVNGPDD